MLKICQFLWIFVPTICLANAEVDLLKRLVTIESGSNQIDKVNEVQAILKSELTHLGFTTKQISPPTGIKTGDLLVSTLKGKTEQTITFIVHADTVFEPSSGFSGFTVSSDGNIAKGPGVIDDKGGMVILIFGLQEYLKVGIPKYTLRIVSSPSEEIGSPGFAEQFQAFSKDSILVLGFEPSLDNKNIVSSRRGNAWFQIDVEGRETHAGRAHKEGVNACVELAEKITQISKLTNYQKNTTVNVGHMEGGQDKYNIVCGNASAKVDTRFETIKEQEQIKRKISEILKSPQVYSVHDHVSSKITFKISSESPPFTKGPHSRYLRKYITAIEEAEGNSIADEQSGGSADTNSFSRNDLPIIDGLGPSGGKMHTKDEFIYLTSLKTRSKALATFLNEL